MSRPRFHLGQKLHGVLFNIPVVAFPVEQVAKVKMAIPAEAYKVALVQLKLRIDEYGHYVVDFQLVFPSASTARRIVFNKSVTEHVPLRRPL